MSETGQSRWRGRRGVVLFAALGASVTCGSIDRLEVSGAGGVLISPTEGQILTGINFDGFQQINLEENMALESEGYTNDQISSVRVTSLSLGVLAPEDGTLDFLIQVAFFAEAEGADRVEIARVDPVPRDLRELELELLDADIAAHAATGSMAIVADVLGASPDEAITLNAAITMDVEVDFGSALGCAVAEGVR